MFAPFAADRRPCEGQARLPKSYGGQDEVVRRAAGDQATGRIIAGARNPVTLLSGSLAAVCHDQIDADGEFPGDGDQGGDAGALAVFDLGEIGG